MTIKLSSLRSDSTKERDGDWIEAPEIGPDVAFLVRSTNYPLYAIKRDQLQAKLRRGAGRGKPIPQDEWNVAHGRLYAEHLLLGWRGFDVDYSQEKARELLTDPEYRVLIASVEYAASQVGTSEIEFLEDAEKNSATPSSTS